jgi:flagellar basal body-associated protein FliL
MYLCIILIHFLILVPAVIIAKIILLVCIGYKWTQPDNCIYVAIEALGVTVDNHAIGGERNITAAVFLPLLPTVHYATTETNFHSIKQYFKGTKAILTNVTDKLLTNGNNVCFIIFIYQWKDEPIYKHYHSHFLTGLFNILKSRSDNEYNIFVYALGKNVILI